MAKLSTILDQVDAGSMLLPEFQRGYVWNRDQVRGFMRSLYLGYPVGSLLVWETDTTDKSVRGGPGGGVRQLLLDGQQRVTSLYGVVRGKPPAFFEGDAAAFTGLRFNVAEETFEFYAPVKMKGDPLWIDVTDLFLRGAEPQIERLASDARNWPYVGRLMKLQNLLEKDFHAEQITGPDKTTDVVVEIFNRVNSGGTKLSKGDLALAKICAQWSGARPTMRSYLQRWDDEGYDFSLDWLLRNVNAVATGRAPFSALDDVSADEFEQALTGAADHIDLLLEEIASRLGLDHARVLPGRPALAVLSRLLSENGGEFRDAAERDKALYWYVHAALSGRFAGSTETYLNQDLATVSGPRGVDDLIGRLRRWRRSLTIKPDDLQGAGKGARYYPLVYLVSRVLGARDFATGEEVATASGLQVQPLFSKAVLSRAGYRPAEINAIANFVLVTPESAAEVARRRPEDYLAGAEELFPGLLASQCLPDDPALWQVTRYRDFLAARRKLLAAAANEILDGLHSGARVDAPRLPRVAVRAGGDDEIDIRAEEVGALVDELLGLGLASPERDAEIPDPETGRALSVAEAVWPDGLQPGQGAPVVLELDPDEADLPRMAELGYEVFTSVEALRGYALRRRKEAGGEAPAEAPVPPVASPAPVAAPPAADPAQEFHQAVLAIYQKARDETGYNATYLLAMLAEDGGVETAKRLLASATVSTGFTALWNKGRLDLTVEALVLDPRFAGLFTADEIDIARGRLAQFDFAV